MTDQLTDPFHFVDPPTPEQVRRAQRCVATLDASIEERALLLNMLGIGPDHDTG